MTTEGKIINAAFILISLFAIFTLFRLIIGYIVDFQVRRVIEIVRRRGRSQAEILVTETNGGYYCLLFLFLFLFLLCLCVAFSKQSQLKTQQKTKHHTQKTWFKKSTRNAFSLDYTYIFLQHIFNFMDTIFSLRRRN